MFVKLRKIFLLKTHNNTFQIIAGLLRTWSKIFLQKKPLIYILSNRICKFYHLLMTQDLTYIQPKLNLLESKAATEIVLKWSVQIKMILITAYKWIKQVIHWARAKWQSWINILMMILKYHLNNFSKSWLLNLKNKN